MAYLQNGSCYRDLSAAKSDFISRVNGVNERVDAVRSLNAMTKQQVSAFFPDCVPYDVFFNRTMSSVMGLVVMLIVFSYVKRAVNV